PLFACSSTPYVLFLFVISSPPLSPFFPYTTLFRSLSPFVCSVRFAMRFPDVYEIVKSQSSIKITYPVDISFRSSWHRIRNLHPQDRKSTRLNSSHVSISYAVFCLKKKTHNT